MMGGIVGIDWGSTSVSAQLIAHDGSPLDAFSSPSGITKVDRRGIADIVQATARRWPDASAIYLSGMIGSSVGWQVVPYCDCPASIADLACALVHADIAGISCLLVPGLTSNDRRGRADVMRGEEVEALGWIELQGAKSEAILALPGTHTKWAKVSGGKLVDFFTAMTGELFDVLATNTLLGEFLGNDAASGTAFERGVEIGYIEGAGLARLIFGVRSQVLRQQLRTEDASSYLRGILIGAELADAVTRYPDIRERTVPLIGNAPLCALYCAALTQCGFVADIADKPMATGAGYMALHHARTGESQ